ncbi:MAG: thiol:disulfide interchange protein DsbG [Gammaproteobacteria bacterium]
MAVKRYIVPIAIASLLATNLSLAALNSKQNSTTTPASNDKAANMVMTLTKGQATIVQSFPSIGNLEGFVVKPAGAQQGQPTIIYADKDGQYAFVGALLTPTGDNQSSVDNQKYIVSSIAEKALGAAQNTAWILDGKADAKHMTYVVADPNCIYCNKLYQVTRPFVNSGDLAIRWIWVGFLKDTSPGLAQAILASNDPIQAMAQDENGFNASTEQGGLTPLVNVPKDVAAKYKQNMDFLGQFQFPGTPVLIYKDQTGKPQAAFGLPVGDQLSKTIDSMSTL